MLKYVEAKVVFSEIPEEITLAISISNCPNRCIGCHSKELWTDIGEELDTKEIKNLIESNKGITCVCFLGGDSEPRTVESLAYYIKDHYSFLKTAWYSGKDFLRVSLEAFDYVKVGSYNRELGPLNSPTTNQKLYKITDITNKFLTL